MYTLPYSVPIAIAGLTVFLTFVVGLTFVIANNFTRTRLIMTAFFVFIVFSLSISFWSHTLATLPYAIPAFLCGAIIGHIAGVRAETEKLKVQGAVYYMEHFAHIRSSDIAALTWWSLINYYSIMGGLLLINLIGVSNVLFEGGELWSIITSIIGAFLIGTIVPYLAHLWSVRATVHAR